jgi:hypothetical protein
MAEQVTISEPETTAEKPEETQADRPEWLPEKFKTPEDMAKAYSELEGKLGKPTDSTGDSDAKGDNLEIEKAEQAVESAGLNMADLQAEYDKDGQLADKSYEALEKAGIPKDYVNAFIEGQKALATQRVTEVRNLVGGNDTYNEMTTWAKDNMSDAEINAYNSAVNSGDMEQTKLAVLGLQARYQSIEGVEPTLTRGKGNVPNTSGAFRSWAEVTSAMKDARYQSDEAYRADVQAKIQNSQL